MKGINIAETCHVTAGQYPVATSGLTTLDAVNMENYSHLTAIILAGVANGTGQTVTVLNSSDASATGAAAIAFNYYKTITAAGDVLGARTAATTAGFLLSHGTVSSTKYVIELDASELTDGLNWVNLTFSGETSTTPTSVVYILSGSRYASPASVSAIA